MAAGDHDAGRRIEHLRGEVQHRRGDHAKVDHVDAGAAQAGRQCLRQVRARQAAVAADDDGGFFFQAHRGAESLTDLPRNADVECLADDAADVVGLENAGRKRGQISHMIYASNVFMVRCLRAAGRVSGGAHSHPVRAVASRNTKCSRPCRICVPKRFPPHKLAKGYHSIKPICKACRSD